MVVPHGCGCWCRTGVGVGAARVWVLVSHGCGCWCRTGVGVGAARVWVLERRRLSRDGAITASETRAFAMLAEGSSGEKLFSCLQHTFRFFPLTASGHVLANGPTGHWGRRPTAGIGLRDTAA